MGEDEDTDRLKRRRMEERQKALSERQAEEKIKSSLRMILDEAAYGRMSNVSAANSELFLLAAQNMLMLYKRVGRKLTDHEVLSVLRAIKERTEKKTSITFHKK